MSIYARMMGLEEPKIPVHQFCAAAAEFHAGKMTGAQATAAFTLSPAEQLQAQQLIAAVGTGTPPLTGDRIHLVLMLAELRIPPYDTEALVKARLGVP